MSQAQLNVLVVTQPTGVIDALGRDSAYWTIATNAVSNYCP